MSQLSLIHINSNANRSNQFAQVIQALLELNLSPELIADYINTDGLVFINETTLFSGAESPCIYAAEHPNSMCVFTYNNTTYKVYARMGVKYFKKILDNLKIRLQNISISIEYNFEIGPRPLSNHRYNTDSFDDKQERFNRLFSKPE